MQDTFITPISGQVPKDYDRVYGNFIDEQKTAFLNKIIRGEISAVDAYEQVIPMVQQQHDRFRLSAIRDEHDSTIEKLKKLVEHSMYEAEEDSGTWGVVVTTIVGAAKLLGNTVALKALNEGEEHGLKLYNEILAYNLNEEERDVIVNELIPSSKRHLAALKVLIEEQDDDYT